MTGTMKKQYFYLLVLLISLMVPVAGTLAGQYDKNVAVDLCFTPGGTCTDSIMTEIGNAHSEYWSRHIHLHPHRSEKR